MDGIVRELRIIEEEYKNRVYSTCEIRICDLARDCADEIEKLQSENAKLKDGNDYAIELLDKQVERNEGLSKHLRKIRTENTKLKAERDKAVELLTPAQLVVIGNTHDNPEILEVNKNDTRRN